MLEHSENSSEEKQNNKTPMSESFKLVHRQHRLTLPFKVFSSA